MDVTSTALNPSAALAALLVGIAIDAKGKGDAPTDRFAWMFTLAAATVLAAGSGYSQWAVRTLQGGVNSAGKIVGPSQLGAGIAGFSPYIITALVVYTFLVMWPNRLVPQQIFGFGVRHFFDITMWKPKNSQRINWALHVNAIALCLFAPMINGGLPSFLMTIIFQFGTWIPNWLMAGITAGIS